MPDTATAVRFNNNVRAAAGITMVPVAAFLLHRITRLFADGGALVNDSGPCTFGAWFGLPARESYTRTGDGNVTNGAWRTHVPGVP